LEKQPPPKIPNNNLTLLIQAKYVLYQAIMENNETFERNEIGLAKAITILQSALIK
jgi:hypothetical protein